MHKLVYLMPVLAGLALSGCGEAGKQMPAQEQSQQSVDQMMEKSSASGGAEDARSGKPLGETNASSVDAMYGGGNAGSSGAPAASGQ